MTSQKEENNKIIEVKKLEKKFNSLTAVDKISFSVCKGQIFAFLGPNGAGKSTTIKMLTTVLRPTSGSMKINGFDPDFNRCKTCHTDNPNEHVRFSIINGSFNCGKCSLREPTAVTISAATIQYLRKLQTISIKNLGSITIATDRECEMLLLSFLQYHIEETKYLKSLKFFREIQNKIPNLE